MRPVRLVMWLLVLIAVAALAVFLLASPRSAQPQQQSVARSDFGGHFTLVDSNGQPFDSETLKGKPYALFFGFTHCPDTCPTTLARLVRLRRQAGGDDAFNIVFVTVDPERDGPKEMGAYANAFGAPITGLTGSPAQIDTVKKQFGIYSQKVPTGDGDYTVDHTATVLLFDRDGKFVATLAPDEQDQVALDKIEARRIGLAFEDVVQQPVDCGDRFRLVEIGRMADVGHRDQLGPGDCLQHFRRVPIRKQVAGACREGSTSGLPASARNSGHASTAEAVFSSICLNGSAIAMS